MEMQPSEPNRLRQEDLKIVSASNQNEFALSGESLARWKRFKFSGLSLNCLLFMILFPAFLLFIFASSSFDLKMLATIAVPCSPLFLYIMSIWRRILAEHESRGLSFKVNEFGVSVRNSSGEKVIPWQGVEAVFPTVQAEYVIQTSGENYFFPQDMERAVDLFQQIKERMPNREVDDFEINSIVAETGNEQMELPAAAFLSAVVLGPLITILSTGKVPIINELWSIALPVVLAAVASIYVYVSLKSSVKLIRCGKNGVIFKRDGERPQYVEWARIRKVKSFGAFMSFETAQQTWFVNWIFFQPVAANRCPAKAGRLKELFVAAKDAQAKVKKLASEKTSAQRKLIT